MIITCHCVCVHVCVCVCVPACMHACVCALYFTAFVSMARTVFSLSMACIVYSSCYALRIWLVTFGVCMPFSACRLRARSKVSVVFPKIMYANEGACTNIKNDLVYKLYH